MGRIRLGGVFEDVTWGDFLGGFVQRQAPALGHEVELTSCLTKGCRFDWLQHHLAGLRLDHDGILVGVDGKKLSTREKRAKLVEGIPPVPAELPVLWAVASPSIEAWMLADAGAVPAALTLDYGEVRDDVAPPVAPRAEARAKEALSDWVEQLVGERFLRGGRELAWQVGANLRAEHVKAARHPELVTFLRDELPVFLRACAARAEGRAR